MTEQLIKRPTKHLFSEAERVNISNQLSQAIIEKSEAEADLKMVQAQYKSRITEKVATISSCAHRLQSGFEMIQVDCRVVYDFENGIVKYMNVETNPESEVDSRPMTREERQMRLPLATDQATDQADI